MKHLALAGILTLAPAAFAQEFKIGSKLPDFQLQDVKGNTVSYNSLKGKTTAIIFIATKCPVSNDYNDRMTAVFNEYSKKGVNFVFINPNSSEPASEVVTHAREVGFTFPVYKDADNVIADRFAAQVTPETFVMDAAGVIRYHGSIDDSRNPARITTQSLRAALDAVTAGKNVAAPETKAFGCTIKRVRKAS